MKCHRAIAVAFAAGASAQTNSVETCKATENYPGWEGIKYAFIFGDSYTTTGFNVSLEQPSPTNPLGNPPYPGWTAANGPNWVDFLTVKYNASMLLTYNLAYGGATVDSALVKPYLPTVLSLKDQVEDLFGGHYASSEKSSTKWTGKDSLFAIWIGINDVGNSFEAEDTNLTSLYHQIFDKYADQVENLRAAGARNFLFLNVPPVDRSPLTLAKGQDKQAAEREAINAFNAWIMAMAEALKGSGESDEVNVWIYDAHADFTEVLDEPKRFEATKGYANIDEYCEAYQNGTPEWDTKDEKCAAAVDEYFWLNSLHPTYPMHDVVAKRIAELLDGNPNVCGKSAGAKAKTTVNE